MNENASPTDWKPGDEPVPVDTLVDYHGTHSHGRYVITGHRLPIRPEGCPEDYMSIAYPDGVAYDLWPEKVPHKMDFGYLRVLNVRRTSFHVTDGGNDGVEQCG